MWSNLNHVPKPHFWKTSVFGRLPGVFGLSFFFIWKHFCPQEARSSAYPIVFTRPQRDDMKRAIPSLKIALRSYRIGADRYKTFTRILFIFGNTRFVSFESKVARKTTNPACRHFLTSVSGLTEIACNTPIALNLAFWTVLSGLFTKKGTCLVRRMEIGKDL